MVHEDKKIEDLVAKLMAVDNLEQAPVDFTSKVMAKVEAISVFKTTTYKPLIPKAVWVLICSGIIAIIAYVYFKSPTSNIGWIEKLRLSNVSINPLENITLNVSSTLMYAIVLFAIMLSIQIPVLKNYFNKRLAF